MTSTTLRPTSTHTDTDIVCVAEGLTKVLGTEGAGEQLSRLYGAERASMALRKAVATRQPIRTIVVDAQPVGSVTPRMTAARRRYLASGSTSGSVVSFMA